MHRSLLTAAFLAVACARGDDAPADSPRHAIRPAERDTASPPVTALSDSVLALVGDYRAALERVRAPGGLARLYARALDLEPLADELEDFAAGNPEAYAKLEGDLTGVDVWVGETIGVEPDLAWFAAEARAHGTAEDRRFFALLRRVYPEGGGWPAWLQGVTPDSATFDPEAVVRGRVLAALNDYLRATPGGAYREHVTELLDDAIAEMLARRCFAPSRDSVVALYDRILPQLAGTAMHDSAAARVAAMRAGTDGSRFGCRA
jgi:hypothetical protein